MRLDVHTHIFPEWMVADRSRYFDGEPAFALLYGHPKAKMVTAEDLIAAMDREHVECSVVFGFPWVDEEQTKRHNDYVLEAATRHPRRLIPLCCVLPTEEWAVEEVARGLAGGMRGAGELALYGSCDLAKVYAVYRGISDLVRGQGGVLLVHANEPVGANYPGKAPQGLAFYYEIVRIAQGIPLILAHWGGGLFFYRLLKKETADLFRGLYVDTAASPYLYLPRIYRVAIDLIGEDRILFGSDYPLLPPSRYLREMDEGGLSTDERTLIEGENAAKLFGLLSA